MNDVGVFEYKLVQFILGYMFCCLIFLFFSIKDIIKNKEFTFKKLGEVMIESTYKPLFMLAEMAG